MTDASFYTHTIAERLLTVDGVSHAYGSNLVLRDVTLHVNNIKRPGFTQGQVVGLAGKSGSGKTTLFNIIAGHIRPTAGGVYVKDEETPVREGTVGVVGQHYPLFIYETVWGNLMLAARRAPGGRKRATERANELLDHFGLRSLKKRYPQELSGGQRQRVAIIQQLLCSEHFLLMDEPYSGLDVEAKDAVCEVISDVAASDEHMTIVIISHDLETTATVADTLVLLGRDRDEHGEPIPGARIQKTENLIERGLCWQKNIRRTPDFQKFMTELDAKFRTL